MIDYEKVVDDYFEEEELADKEYDKAMANEEYKKYNLQKQGIIWEEIDEVCQRCIYDQIQKYKHFENYRKKNLATTFMVPCKGIPKQHVTDELFK